ncbi:MAG: FecR domain-containing protein [Pyrinomonadaceae bacterium]|nr:FecR domain-containing protein [Pyrinomonadaceae bacterium]
MNHQPEEKRFRKFYVEWWKIRRSTIYGLIAAIVLLIGVAFTTWYALRYDWFSQADLSDAPKDAAKIISFEGDVRITRAATRETIVVTKQTYAAAGDTIQTQSDGKAVIQMIDGSVFSVRPNSTVVIRDNSSLFGGRNVRVALDDGQLNVRTQEQMDGQNVVEMMDSETKLREQTDASFNADAATNGGEIRISRGSVETTVGGQTATITENEFAAVNNGKISDREKLMLAPRPANPANAAQMVDSSGSGVSVAFSWSDDSPGVASYHLQVARSPYFALDSILVDRSGLTSREFRLAGISPGTYYWRIKSSARSGQMSEWSEPARFNVARGSSNSGIDVSEWNVERVGGTVYILSGRTRPGLLVRAQGREVFAGGDGSFRLQVSTPSSEIAIEMSDDRGNRAGFVLSLRTAQVVRRF